MFNWRSWKSNRNVWYIVSINYLRKLKYKDKYCEIFPFESLVKIRIILISTQKN